MKLSLILSSLFFSIFLVGVSHAQAPGTEVYLFDLVKTETAYELLNPKNISNNPGYDNQPSFLNDDSGVLMASTRNGQTDVALFDLENESLKFLNSSPGQSEYSPTQTPAPETISFVILTEDGVQQFWEMNLKTGETSIIESEEIIGYCAWYTTDTYFCFVLATETSPATLQMHNTSSGEKTVLSESPGRSIHKIPNENAISFIDNSTETRTIKAYYPETKTFKELAPALTSSQDMTWTPAGEMLMGLEDKLYLFKNSTWVEIADLSEFGLTSITRMDVNNRGDQLVIVVEE